MAQQATEKKKKKGIVQRMMFGNDDKPDLTPERASMTKWALFKFLFFRRVGTMVLLNILTLLFALPAILVIFLFYMNKAVAAGFIPYSSNIGIGYPVVVDAISQGAMTDFNYTLMQYLILIPCIAFFALGVSGSLYVIRKLIWEEPTRTVRDFFRGIKKCWLHSLFMGTVFGLTLLLFVFSLDYFDVYGLSVGLKVTSVILSSLLLVFIILFTSFFMTQHVAFKMRPLVLIRNSILFVFGTNIQAIFFIGLALLPVYLMLIPGITTFVLIIGAFFAFSFTELAISVYCHHCYEKFLYDKITDKPATVYAKRGSDIAEAPVAQAKKKQPTAYKNPKKRKRSIDEGASITPLAPTFRREDLERLQKEHEQVLKESNDADTDTESEKTADAANDAEA